MPLPKYSVEYLKTAVAELAVIIDYYTQISEKTAINFLNELLEIEGALAITPYAHSLRSLGSGRTNCKTYPYYVSYRILEPEKRIIITGVQPQRTDPKSQHP